MGKASFIPIPNLSDDTINRLQGNISRAFQNVDTPTSVVVTTVTKNYIVSADDDVVLCDPSAGPFAVTLPALGRITKPVSLRTIGASTNAVTLSAPAPTTIDGATSLTLSATPRRLVSNAQGYWSA